MNLINTALCSFGMSGKLFHAPFIEAHPGFKLYGVWERSKNNAIAEYPKVKTFRTLEEMCSVDQINLIIVNTPSSTHYDFAKQVINSGKHLIVEKPFTATVKQAEELISLSIQKNVKLSVFHNRRYDSDFKTVQKVLKEGSLGTLVDSEIHYDRYSPELSYKLHKEEPTGAVGSLYDLGSHLIDQALQLFGLPDSIFAHLDIMRPNSKVCDYFDVKLFYPFHNVTLKSSYYVKEVLPAFIFHGTKGSFVKPRADVQEADLKEGKLPRTSKWGVEPEEGQGLLHVETDGKTSRKKIQSLKGNYMDYFDGIYDAIQNGESVPISGSDGLNVIRIIEAAIKSDREKRVIEL